MEKAKAAPKHSSKTVVDTSAKKAGHSDEAMRTVRRTERGRHKVQELWVRNIVTKPDDRTPVHTHCGNN